MPSWENVEEAINFTLHPKKDAHPELFAASRQAKAMGGDEHGRQSVRYVTELQFPKEEEPDIRKLNRALKNLCDDVKAATEMPASRFPFEEKPPPPPTDEELYQRMLRERVDKIGHLKPEAVWQRDKWGEQSLSDWLTSSVANVKARGGVLQYPPSQHARSHRDHHWYTDAVRGTEDDMFVNSLFRARNLTERRHLHARPLTAPPVQHRRQVLRPDGTWGGQWETFVPAEQHLAQRDWRYPRDLAMGARSKDAPFDINEFLSQSVFKNDTRAEMERRAREEDEERRAHTHERERIAKEEYQRFVEEQERAELRARHQAYLALQKSQEERELAEEAFRKEQRETERLHALREQRAREAEEAALRREMTLRREAEERMLKEAESLEAQRRNAERQRRKEEEELANEELSRQRRIQEQHQLEDERQEAERQRMLARERAEQHRIEEAARRQQAEREVGVVDSALCTAVCTKIYAYRQRDRETDGRTDRHSHMC